VTLLLSFSHRDSWPLIAASLSIDSSHAAQSQLAVHFSSRADTKEYILSSISYTEMSDFLSAGGLAAHSADLATFLHTHTSGLPLLVNNALLDLVQQNVIVATRQSLQCDIERLRVASIPDSVAQYSRDTLGRVPAHCSRLTEVLAVSCLPLSAPSLAALLSRDPGHVQADLRSLVALRVLSTCSSGEIPVYSFSHESIRLLCYDRLDAASRRSWHHRLGRYFESIDTPEGTLTEALAHHYLKAIDSDLGPRYAFLAAERARERFAHRTALALYRAGVDLLPASSIHDRFVGLDNIAQLLTSLGLLSQAVEHYNEMLLLARRHGERRFESRAVLALAQLYVDTGDLKRGIAYGEIASSASTSVNDGPGRARAYAIQAQAYRRLGHLAEATTLAESAYGAASAGGDIMSASLSRNIQGLIENDRGEYQKAIAYFRQALDLKTGINDVVGMAMGLNNIGLVYLEEGELTLAESHFQKAVDEAKQHGLSLLALLSSSNLSEIMRIRGRYAESISLARDALAIADASNRRQFVPYLLYSLGMCGLEVGDYDLAFESFTRAESDSDLAQFHLDMCLVRAGLVRLWADCGHLSRSITYAEIALQAAHRLGFKQALCLVADSAARAGLPPRLWQPFLNAQHELGTHASNMSSQTAVSLLSIRCEELLNTTSYSECLELAVAGLATARHHSRKRDELRLLYVVGRTQLLMKRLPEAERTFATLMRLSSSLQALPYIVSSAYYASLVCLSDESQSDALLAQSRIASDTIVARIATTELRMGFLASDLNLLNAPPDQDQHHSHMMDRLVSKKQQDTLRSLCQRAIQDLFNSLTGVDTVIGSIFDEPDARLVVNRNSSSVVQPSLQQLEKDRLAAGETLVFRSPQPFGGVFVPLGRAHDVFGYLFVGKAVATDNWLVDAIRQARSTSSFIQTACSARIKRSETLHDRSSLRIRAQDPFESRSEAMRPIYKVLGSVIKTACNVLLLGESGTGKEVLAREIHSRGARASRPFVPLDCGAIPEGLVESELFGFQRGAFSGADFDKRGVLEEAHGGTLFLDEIANTSLSFQAKLLRALQSGEFRRLGDTTYRKVDARVIAATNADLEALVREGKFRDDLYYRLNVVTLRLPPLRERVEDIQVLAEHFARRFCESRGIKFSGISSGALVRLKAYRWPGNVRELEHAVEAALVVSGDGVVRRESLPEAIRGDLVDEVTGLFCEEMEETLLDALDPSSVGVDSPLDDAWSEERSRVEEALRRSSGDKSAAARLLGWNRMRLYRALRRHGIPYKGKGRR
jgi:two-component system, NtrC family, response regulator AtoC